MANCTRFQVKNCVELTNKKTRRAARRRNFDIKKEGRSPLSFLQIELEIAQKVESYHAPILYRFYSK